MPDDPSLLATSSGLGEVEALAERNPFSAVGKMLGRMNVAAPGDMFTTFLHKAR